MSPKPSIVYCAKHPVNFAMFEPVYNVLRNDPSVDLLISTGRYRRRLFYFAKPLDPELVNEKIFAAFDIDPRHLGKTSCRDKRRYDLYASSNGSFRMRPQNARVSVQIFHGVSFRNFAINESVLRFDKLFIPGPYHARQFVERGLLSEGDPRVEIMGMPKIDALVNGTFPREKVLRDLGLDPGRPTVCWCPTGARNNSFEEYGEGVFRAVEAAGCNLILKLHDHPHLPEGVTAEGILNQARGFLKPNQKLGMYPSVAQYLAAADVLISDASSVAYEYTVLDRPIIFLDVPKLIDFRASMEKTQMDLNTHGRKCGTVVDNAADLSDVIKGELSNPGRMSAERRRTANDIFFEPGTATVRMVKRLKELAGARG